MVSLTTRQNRLLRYLLDEFEPKTSADIGRALGLTPRQVNYNLKTIRHWLIQHRAELRAIPGKGVEVVCAPTKRQQLIAELNAPHSTKVVLTAAQRRQLIALSLLCAIEPVILYRLQNNVDASRTTVLSDLDAIETWVHQFGLLLIRRQNYGVFLEGSEWRQRQALAALLWGDTSFGKPLTKITYKNGLASSWLESTLFSATMQKMNISISKWDIHTALEWVASAEADLGGRFTDDSVLLLALALAIQVERVENRHILPAIAINRDWLKQQVAWSASEKLLHRMFPQQNWPELTHERTYIALQLLSATRSENWPTDKEIEFPFNAFIQTFMTEASRVFREPDLSEDMALRDGLAAHIIPACIREQFNIWNPDASTDEPLPAGMEGTYAIVRSLVAETTAQTGISVPESEFNNLTLLLRAALIRCHPRQKVQALVVCPSGMATAQLIVARLKARIPNLGIKSVLSVRELAPEKVQSAQLIVSTIPLDSYNLGLKVIQVHPLLLPEDINAITSWLASRTQLPVRKGK